MLMLQVICTALLCAVAITDAVSVEKGRSVNGGQLEWWENGVFYQIYPRSFKDSDGDGVGDIRGIIEKLDYLQELGIAGAWLSPIFKSPMKDFGYDISDFRTIDPIFGTMEDLEELFIKANAKGIPIILDFVPNHTSDQHEWFQKSIDRDPIYEDFYIWADGRNNNKDPPNNWPSNFYGSAWTYNEKRKQWYYHEFVKEQPDLNYRNEAVVKEMLDVLEFWLKKGAGGFRIDAINYLFEDKDLRDEPLSGLTNDPLSHDYTLHYYTADLPEVYDMVFKFRQLMDDFKKQHRGQDRILMTEAYVNSTTYPKYFKSDDGKQIGSQMPFNFDLIMELTRDSTATHLKNVIDNKISSVPAGTRLNWVIGNHDRPRVASRFGERKNNALLTLVMTLPGIAVTYNGEEIGMLDNRDGITFAETRDPKALNVKESGNWREKSRDPQRTPMQWDGSQYAGFMPANATKDAKPWLPIHPNHVDINVELQKNSERSTLNFYKQLMQLRKEPAFAIGSFESKVVNDNVFMYTRARNDSASYLVLINYGAREELINIISETHGTVKNMPGEAEIAVAGTDSCYSKGDLVDTASVVLRKYDVLILKMSSASSSVIASATLLIGVLLNSLSRAIF